MNKKGQMTVEAVLIITVFLGISIFVSTQFRNNELLAKLVHGPWAALSGMAKYGVWEKENDAYSMHPNGSARRTSVRGDDPK